ncbi:SpvB/TcaC N-terminal domain-containing protein [Thiothrix nivea]|uniref:RHS repeat-associated core domain-containing protein n=1 Tax=Thiothrix nivea (strain ATCC 35100 / DSM 5205 / JP2) TaxID=870187 RepID=A0A656HCD2_THINJ|nr:SpvB/TcaC N-terminal domain-containing protein [Thiothrix nivea]EIJ33096.1 RHS repeat-associated core domain-containing protein [Thiothrix nivea DSM 5205]
MQEQHDQKNTSEDNFRVTAPAISLPKGGGAIRGMGEKFAANPVTGTGSLSVPIATSPGRNGFGPQLALSYDSGAGNGIFGLGWNLALPSITRRTDKGLPQYRDGENSDSFILSGSEDLVPLNSLSSREVDSETYQVRLYRPRVEGLFARIECWTRNRDGDVHWRSFSKDNILSIYGRDTGSRITDPADGTRTFSWLLSETRDDKGNAVLYDYKAENTDGVDVSLLHQRNRTEITANRYIKRIRYGNKLTLLDEQGNRPVFLSNDQLLNADWMFEVVLDYGEHTGDTPTPDETGQWPYRPDAFSNYRAGFEVRTSRLCQRVLMFHHFPEQAEVGRNCLVRSTDFHYTDQHYSVIRSVTQSGYHKQADGRYQSRQLPPLEFEYSQAQISGELCILDKESLENLPAGLDGQVYQWLDLDGEGLSGILTQQAEGWFYKRNYSPLNTFRDDQGELQTRARFASQEMVARKPSLMTAGDGQYQFLDLAGDGQLEAVTFAGTTPGFYERTTLDDWEWFQPFRSLPNIDWANPNLKFVDLTGDGHADILISEDELFCWYPSLGEAGFGLTETVRKVLDEEHGPRIVFADGTQSIFLADMSGDGLTDIVRIRNGEVCYWPNQGYGHFGSRISMDAAPWFDHPDLFNQQRIRLADIDGSGVTDILYLGRDNIQVYFNLSGNTWGNRHDIRHFPATDNIGNVQVVDLLGNGTACLVWSSPLPADTRQPLRYLDLMGGQKPHLLIASRNNLGLETRIEYTPSTRFYLQDKLAGKPWITRLPFPVHCVEKVTVTDKWRGTRFTTQYSYHHGYFDGVEREFRGFGRVEQVDVEAYGEFSAGNASSPYISQDKTLYQPPVKTVTWFHTGVFLDRQRILSHFGEEYFPNGFNTSYREHPLPEPDFADHDLSDSEWREALRACKGMMLRQEIYELDVAALERGEHLPVKLFSTAFHNCHIRRLQERGNNRYAVFLVTESEALTYHYELALPADPAEVLPEPDPRIAHTLNLTTDNHGNVLQAVAAVYPRRQPYTETGLPEAALAKIIAVQQGEPHLLYTENHLTRAEEWVNTPDVYRLPVPCEVLTYEVTGIPLRSGSLYYSLAQLRNQYSFCEEYQPLDGRTALVEIAYHDIAGNLPQKRCVEHVRTLFFNDDLINPLPFRSLSRLGLPFESYKLALTSDLLDRVFAGRLETNSPSRQMLDDASQSGYLGGNNLAARFSDKTGSGEYWMRSGIAGFSADAARHFYLPERYTDAFGNTTELAYDQDDLFITASTDPIGNRASIEAFDYRVLAPRILRDMNGNETEARFDLLGLPVITASRGKQGEGDHLDGLENAQLDPDSATLAAFFTGSPYTAAHAEQTRVWLGNATSRHIYYFGEVQRTDANGNSVTVWGEHPACACGIVRERHVSQSDGNPSPLQVAFEYSDGGGNVLVKKVQAEPEQAGGALRWIANGKTVLNNKGKPVKQYEPYFSTSRTVTGEDIPDHRFEEPREEGVTPILYYDAAGRVMRTELPDGTLSRVEFSPWHVSSYDPGDTVLESGNVWYGSHVGDTALMQQVASYAGTPARTFLDKLGREVVSLAHNRYSDAAGVLHDEQYLTFTRLDTEGKPLWIQDARGNRVMQYIYPPVPANQADDPVSGFAPCYDIAGNLLYQYSMDAGARWMITDAAGKPFLAWDQNERIQTDSPRVMETRVFHNTYDALHRPLTQQLSINDAGWQVVERFVYGESQPEPETHNLRGQVYQHYDPSGLVTNRAFDFKGNLLETSRQLAQAYTAPVVDWAEGAATAQLEAETFIQRTGYDALNRMIRLENWHREGSQAAVYTPTYNERGVLQGETLAVRGRVTEAIGLIRYNAKGQRSSLRYGNNTESRYEYDPQTFRLVRLRTESLTGSRRLQDLRYSYDPVGNIVAIRDEAQQTVYFNNSAIAPHGAYRYDALYRLIQAEGREHATQNNVQRENTPFEPLGGIPFANSPEALQRYREDYQYDAVGNILSLTHSGGGNLRWKRCYQYALDSNRLLATGRAGEIAPPDAPCHAPYVAQPTLSLRYDYDTHGSMLNLERVGEAFYLRWDYRDMIHHVNLGGGGVAWYNYDAGKQRTRKRIEHNANRVEERLYLGGMELYRRWQNGALVEEIETHHLFADDQRILIVEDVLSTDNPRLETNTTLFRYQYGNHLGSVALEMDAAANIISYEEYHPYGTTAYHAVNADIRTTKKRYRYTGMERDEETGLSYHTARYYLPRLVRWISSDPMGIKDGLNEYLYVKNLPISLNDKNGLQASASEYSMPGLPGGVGDSPCNNCGTPIPESTPRVPESTPRVPESTPRDPHLRRRVLIIGIDGGVLGLPTSGEQERDGDTTIGRILDHQEANHPDNIDVEAHYVRPGLTNFTSTQATLDWLDKREIELGYQFDSIIIVGYSHGGLIAMDLSHEFNEQHRNVDLLVTIDPAFSVFDNPSCGLFNPIETSVPDNVGLHYNFYQENRVSPGGSNVLLSRGRRHTGNPDVVSNENLTSLGVDHHNIDDLTESFVSNIISSSVSRGGRMPLAEYRAQRQSLDRSISREITRRIGQIERSTGTILDQIWLNMRFRVLFSPALQT